MMFINTKKPPFPFSVLTCGSSVSKAVLIELYEKYVGPVTTRDVMVRQNKYDVLVFNIEDVFHAEGNDLTYVPEIISYEDAIIRLVSHKKFVPIKVTLNASHIAEIQQDGSVNVGCQHYTKESIKELIKAVNSVDNP